MSGVSRKQRAVKMRISTIFGYNTACIVTTGYNIDCYFRPNTCFYRLVIVGTPFARNSFTHEAIYWADILKLKSGGGKVRPIFLDNTDIRAAPE